jgi:hypothetical protein
VGDFYCTERKYRDRSSCRTTLPVKSTKQDVKTSCKYVEQESWVVIVSLRERNETEDKSDDYVYKDI